MNKNNLNIIIIGGGLLGCLTALKLNDAGYKKITITDKSKILGGFKSINIKNKKFDNGFHGIELPRASSLKNYLEKKLNYKFKIKKNDRRIIIYDKLIRTNEKITNWPINLKKFFPRKKIGSKSRAILFKNLDLELQNFFKKIGKRYSKNINDYIHQFIPWFLPTNISLINNKDEGDIFRENVLKKKIKTFYAFPPNSSFEDLSKKILKKLKEININLEQNSKLNLNEVKKFKKKNLYIYCASSVPFLTKKFFKKLTKNEGFLHSSFYELKKPIQKQLSGITEILCANDEIPEMSRISFPERNKKVFIQIESFIKTHDDIKNFESKIDRKIHKVLSINKNNLKKIESRISRKVFFPSISLLTKCLLIAHSKIKKDFHKNFIYKSYFGPINMSKTWVWSDEILQEIKNYETR